MRSAQAYGRSVARGSPACKSFPKRTGRKVRSGSSGQRDGFFFGRSLLEKTCKLAVFGAFFAPSLWKIPNLFASAWPQAPALSLRADGDANGTVAGWGKIAGRQAESSRCREFSAKPTPWIRLELCPAACLRGRREIPPTREIRASVAALSCRLMRDRLAIAGRSLSNRCVSSMQLMRIPPRWCQWCVSAARTPNFSRIAPLDLVL